MTEISPEGVMCIVCGDSVSVNHVPGRILEDEQKLWLGVLVARDANAEEGVESLTNFAEKVIEQHPIPDTGGITCPMSHKMAYEQIYTLVRREMNERKKKETGE